MTTYTTRQHARGRAIQRRRQSQRWLLIGITITALMVAGVLIILSLPRVIRTISYDGLEQALDRSGALGLAIGSGDASVTLTEYSDFSCTHCHDLVPVIHQLIEEYGRAGQLRVVYKPISFVNPPYSTEAAAAAICSGEQGRFWEMHDEIWSIYERSGPGAYHQGTFGTLARNVGLDGRLFDQCIASADTSHEVQAVLEEASAMGVSGTPTLFVNGRQVPYNGADAIYSSLRVAIEGALGN